MTCANVCSNETLLSQQHPIKGIADTPSVIKVSPPLNVSEKLKFPSLLTLFFKQTRVKSVTRIRCVLCAHTRRHMSIVVIRTIAIN